MIVYKGIEHERLGDAPFIGALIIAAQCSGNCPGCFNQHVKEDPNIFDTAEGIIRAVKANHFNEGIILGGLEWSEQPFDLLELIAVAKVNDLEVIVYTRRTELDFLLEFPDLQHARIWIKFGSYQVEQQSDTYFDHGVKLATTNQYIKYMGGSTMGIKCCHKCTDRRIGCHGSCPRYKEESRLAQEEKDAMRMEKAKRGMIDDYVCDRSVKAKARAHR